MSSSRARVRAAVAVLSLAFAVFAPGCFSSADTVEPGSTSGGSSGDSTSASTVGTDTSESTTVESTSAASSGPSSGPSTSGSSTGSEMDCTETADPGGNFLIVHCDLWRTWDEAENYCQSLGGRLPSIHFANENDFLRGLVVGGTHPWIGLNDQAVEGEFVWSDGSPSNYLNWEAGQPDDAEMGEDCAVLENTGFWLDTACLENNPILCKIPL